jgi:hypothetical protein
VRLILTCDNCFKFCNKHRSPADARADGTFDIACEGHLTTYQEIEGSNPLAPTSPTDFCAELSGEQSPKAVDAGSALGASQPWQSIAAPRSAAGDNRNPEGACQNDMLAPPIDSIRD